MTPLSPHPKTNSKHKDSADDLSTLSFSIHNTKHTHHRHSHYSGSHTRYSHRHYKRHSKHHESSSNNEEEYESSQSLTNSSSSSPSTTISLRRNQTRRTHHQHHSRKITDSNLLHNHNQQHAEYKYSDLSKLARKIREKEYTEAILTCLLSSISHLSTYVCISTFSFTSFFQYVMIY